MTIDNKTKQILKGKAHKLSPVIIIGNKGLTPAVHLEIERALIDHELIKIKINSDERDERKEMIEKICQKHIAELIQSIGKTITIFRENEEEK